MRAKLPKTILLIYLNPVLNSKIDIESKVK